MIITLRSANPSYSTDAVAASLRAVIAAPLAPRASSAPNPAPAAQAPVDFAILYPALFAPSPRPSLLQRSARAVAFRLSVFGATAAMLVLLHR